MELGKINGRGQNTNVLHEAVHPSHGLVWTDGKAIFLVPVQIHDGHVERQESLKLGEFGDESEFVEHGLFDEEDQSVRSVHWSSDVGSSMCYLGVVHHQHVSIWKVEGHVPKLSFKQVRKLNVQPIQQGCLWNPGRDILCVLSKQQCSFFFKHTEARSSYAFPPIESAKISCGAWSADGHQLVVCVGAMLQIYSWPDIDESISDVTTTAWRIPQLVGGVSSLASLTDRTVLCAADLPLESLCKVQDTFLLPDFNQNEADLSHNSDVITNKEGGTSSVRDTLMNLPRHPESLIQDTSQLVVVGLQPDKEPHRSCCVGVKSVLTPDILLYEESERCVIVGSSSQSLLQVYAVVNNRSLVKVQEINLEKDERPKGICRLHNPQLAGYHGILVALGKRTSTSSLFPSSIPADTGDVRLQFYPLSIDRSAIHAVCDPDTMAPPSLEDQGLIEGIVPSNTSTPVSQSQQTTITLQTSVGEDDASERQNVNLESSLEPINLFDNAMSEASSKQTSHDDSVDLLFKKQKTISELRDYSDTDSSKSSPRDSAQDSDLSPREITPADTSKNLKIVDLDKSDSAESDLETETTEFSEQKPQFQRPDLDKYVEDNVGHTHTSTVSKDSPDLPTQIKPDGQETVHKESEKGDNFVVGSNYDFDAVERDRGAISNSNMAEKSEQGAVSKSNMVEDTEQGAVSKSNMVEDTEQGAVSKSNMVADTEQGAVSKSNMVEDTEQGAISKSNMVADTEQGAVSKSNMVEDTEQGAVSKSNMVEDTEQGPVSKSNMVADTEQRAVLKSNMVEDTEQGAVSKSNMVEDTEQGAVSKSNMVADTEQGAVLRSNMVEDTEQGAVSKSNMVEDTEQGAISDANMSIEDLEREIQIQNDHIKELQNKVDSLSRIVEETSVVFPTKYQVLEKPDVVQVVCRCVGAKDNKKTFLLDNGRLPLDVLKHAFGLSLVELYVDGEPFIVGCNIDGYIPVKFDPSSTIDIGGILQPTSDHDSASEDMGIGGIDKDVTC